MKLIIIVPFLISLSLSASSWAGDVNTPMPGKGHGDDFVAHEGEGETQRTQSNEAGSKPSHKRPLLPPQFGIYGFARVDAVYSSGQMANPQVGFWAISQELPMADESTFALHPKYSRIGLTWKDKVETDAGDVVVLARIETDFFGGGSESDALPRIRVAYGEVQYGAVSLRAGQDWDLFSPLFTGGLQQAAFWNGGNLGDRRPLVRLGLAPKWGSRQLVMAVAAMQSGVVDNADVDGDGRVDGTAWGAPALEAIAELKFSTWPKGKQARVGVSGHYGGTRIHLEGERLDFAVEAVNLHAEVPIGVLTFGGEVWMGSNVSDLRGGIAQGVVLVPIAGSDDAVRAESIAARGGWAHVYIDPVKWVHMGGGLGVDAPVDVPSGGRELNRTYFGQVSLRLWRSFEVTGGYDLYRTSYRDLKNATVHRGIGYTAVHF